MRTKCRIPAAGEAVEIDKQWENSLTIVSSAPGEQRAATGAAQALPGTKEGFATPQKQSLPGMNS